MKNITTFCITLVLQIACPATILASDIDWSHLPETSITLFYPGQSSWEWLLTKHSGAKSVRKGSPCLECHEDEEKDMGDLIVKGGKLEPNPILGKPGSVDVKIKTAYDNEQIYFQIKWNDIGFNNNNSGSTEKFKTKLTLMLGDKSVKEFPVAGCWGVCHDDATNMRSNHNNKKRQLYTSASRLKITRHGGGDKIVKQSRLDAFLKNRKFLEYWQTRLNDRFETSNSHGYILEKRHQHKHPIFTTKIEKKQDTWLVEYSRARSVSQPGTIPFEKNHVYTLGIALHDNHASGRRHYVSFGRSFSMGNDSTDLSATKIH